MRLKTFPRLVAYHFLAKHLPSSDQRLGKWARPIRRAICTPLFKAAGKNINIEKGAFFAANRSKPIDPNSPDWGLASPHQIRFEYVYADPKSPAYSGASKAVINLSVLNPAQVNPFQSPLTTAIQLAANEKMTVRKLAADNTPAVVKFVASPLFGSPVPNLPVIFYYASKNAEAGANLVLSCGALTSGGTGPIGALAGFLAWGPDKNLETINESSAIDAARRAPICRRSAVAH